MKKSHRLKRRLIWWLGCLKAIFRCIQNMELFLVGKKFTENASWKVCSLCGNKCKSLTCVDKAFRIHQKWSVEISIPMRSVEIKKWFSFFWPKVEIAPPLLSWSSKEAQWNAAVFFSCRLCRVYCLVLELYMMADWLYGSCAMHKGVIEKLLKIICSCSSLDNTPGKAKMGVHFTKISERQISELLGHWLIHSRIFSNFSVRINITEICFSSQFSWYLQEKATRTIVLHINLVSF